MLKMSYKGVSWPQNPEQYQQYYLREPVYEKDLEGNTVFAGMGPMKLKITGSGAFFGTNAYSNFKTLSNLFTQSAAGELSHPVWGTVQAFFTKLELTQMPKENYVAYSFEFTGADASGAIPK